MHASHLHQQTRFAVIPVPVRMNANPNFAGRGITIAVLDSGFYPHPDLTNPVNRILAYADITNPSATLDSKATPESYQWHGTQTAVTAAGNGYLSQGWYRSIAPEANLVLVTVSDQGKVNEENIARAIRWVIANKDRYRIRILSISLGGDNDVPYATNIVDQAAENAVRAGVVVIAAAGNSGCTDHHHTVPPANSPSVITVGGYSDNNRSDETELELYCSSYGITADGYTKPEIIAPAMWIAAPILPQTLLYLRAQALTGMAAEPDYRLPVLVRDLWREAGLDARLYLEHPARIRHEIERRLLADKIVATHYQHVDGTSFAAPIVASIVAQMLEANPQLTPAAVKRILISAAGRLPDKPVARQGFGAVHARRSVELARNESSHAHEIDMHPPRIEENRIVFSFHDDNAHDVRLVGDFNCWNPSAQQLRKEANGIWKAALEVPSPGKYRYKFVIDGNRWMEDPANGLKESDPYGGFNSVIHLVEEID